MRLGVDARPLSHPQTGIGRYTGEILSQIAEQTSWDVVLYGFAGATDRDRFELRTVERTLGSSTLWFQTRMSRALSKDGVSCFFSPRHHIPLRMNIPSVVTIHDLVWKKAPETMTPMGRLADQWLMPAAIRAATRIIAVSNDTRNEIVKHFPASASRISVIHEAAFSATGTVRPHLSGRFLLAVGTAEPRKNYPRLLKAFNGVRLKHPDIQLVIAGGKGWKLDLHQLIAQVPGESPIVILDECTDEQLDGLYRHCEFLVSPSLYEGFCLPIVEAMARGKAIVAANAGAMPEVAGTAAILVDPVSVQDIEQGMLRLLEDPRTRSQLEASARVESLRFSWRKAGRATVEALECALHEHK